MFKKIITGEKIYYLEFTYPLTNLREIVSEIERDGQTSTKPLNNITKQYNVRLEPSKTLCRTVPCESFHMVYIVKSFVANIGQRMAIRKTWGTEKNIRLKTLFVLGYLEDLQDYVVMESNKYHDIIQLDMIDNYTNLVHKTIFSILWLAGRNINTRYVHLLDDDRMVNTLNLYDFATDNMDPMELKMIGHQVSFGMPFRDSSSKWFISLNEYPFDLWPPYLIGGTILTNMNVIRKIAIAFPYTNIIRMEDTFIGILAKLLHIKVIHNSEFLPFFKAGSELKNKLSSPDYKSYYAMMEGWRQMHE